MNRKERKRLKARKKKVRASERKRQYQRKLRGCGGCKACCYVYPVPEYNKLRDQWCQHICDVGCAIHSQHRHPICTSFKCLYLQANGRLPIYLRPDKCGVIFKNANTSGLLVIGALFQRSDFSQVMRNVHVRHLVNSLKMGGLIVLFPRGGGVFWDRARYTEEEVRQIVGTELNYCAKVAGAN